MNNLLVITRWSSYTSSKKQTNNFILLHPCWWGGYVDPARYKSWHTSHIGTTFRLRVSLYARVPYSSNRLQILSSPNSVPNTTWRKFQNTVRSRIVELKWCIWNSHNSHSESPLLLTWYLGLPLRYRIQLPSLREELKCLRRSPMHPLRRKRGPVWSLLLYHLRRRKLHDQKILSNTWNMLGQTPSRCSKTRTRSSDGRPAFTTTRRGHYSLGS